MTGFVFQGSFPVEPTSDGMVSIPEKFQFGLKKDIVTTVDPLGYLVIYPEASWSLLKEEMRSWSSLDPEKARIKRVILGNATIQRMTAGQLALEPNQARLLGSETATEPLVIAGVGDHLEIWKSSAWNKFLSGFSLP